MLELKLSKHLLQIEVVRQLKLLLDEYNKIEDDDQENSFSTYYYNKSIDSIKKFLMICIPEESISSLDEDDEDLYDQTINYYTNKLLSLRGTLKIFEVLDEINKISGIKIKTTDSGELCYTYNISEFSITFEEVDTGDINLFTASAKEFFKALLYFKEYDNYIELVRFNFETDLSSNISGNIECFSQYEIDEKIEE